EIEQAIAIVIDEARARSPTAITRYASGPGDIGECSIAVVAEELIGRPEVRDEHVDEAIVVDVADRDAHAVSTRAETRLLGDDGELERPASVRGHDGIVVEQARGARRRGGALSCLGERRALHD